MRWPVEVCPQVAPRCFWGDPARATKPAQATEDTLAKLVQNLADAEAALQAHLGDQVDSITDHEGHPLLLTQAQQKLIDSETMQRMAAQTQKGILDAIPAHIALLDSTGEIMVVNESWRKFAMLNDMESPDFGVGSNYLKICDTATGDCSNEAPSVAQGIRSVIEGKVPEFTLEYPCHSPTEQRWFRLMVSPVSSTDERAGVVVMHLNNYGAAGSPAATHAARAAAAPAGSPIERSSNGGQIGELGNRSADHAGVLVG